MKIVTVAMLLTSVAQPSAGAADDNLVVEVPFEVQSTAIAPLGDKRLRGLASWAGQDDQHLLVVVPRPGDGEPPELSGERTAAIVEFLRNAGVSAAQIDNLSEDDPLVRLEPSAEREVRYVHAVIHRFTKAARTQRRAERRERRDRRRETREQRDSLFGPIAYAVFAGGGVLGYVDDDARAATNLTPTWELSLALRTNRRLASELTYVGAVSDATSGGGTLLITTLVEGAFRLQTQRFAEIFRPYGFMGVGAGVVAGRDNMADGENRETIVSIPLGVGLDFAFGHVHLDVRALFRLTVFDDFAFDSERGGGLDHWQAAARLGWRL